jgi:hypothetical protein
MSTRDPFRVHACCFRCQPSRRGGSDPIRCHLQSRTSAARTNGAACVLAGGIVVLPPGQLARGLPCWGRGSALVQLARVTAG